MCIAGKILIVVKARGNAYNKYINQSLGRQEGVQDGDVFESGKQRFYGDPE